MPAPSHGRCHRRAYPNAAFALTEPRVQIDGSAAELAAQDEHLRIMLDALLVRLAEVTAAKSTRSATTPGGPGTSQPSRSATASSSRA
jgi:hypothetical protein